jgi:hypothetical protein
MTTRKIVSDQADTIFIPSEREEIQNALVLTGGGTTQTFFAMGAVGCLIDNGLFDFDLITAVSGGSLLLVFLELCHNEAYNYYNEPDWYNKYLRKNMYALATARLVPYLIRSGFDLAKLQDYIFSRIPDFNKTITTTENKVFICEYNYIDGNKMVITSDHSDVIDINNGIKKDYWYLIRPARCGLPLSKFNNLPAYDCGNVSNIPVSALLTKYKINRLVIIKSAGTLTYDKYQEKTYKEMILGLPLSNTNSSSNSLDDMIDLSVKTNPYNIMCTASNGLNQSKDVFHKDMIYDLQEDLSIFVRFYNGLLYTNENAMRITENEGYIQMYHQLKSRGQANVFNIPNPEVYNENTKPIWSEWKDNTNFFYELVKDTINIELVKDVNAPAEKKDVICTIS